MGEFQEENFECVLSGSTRSGRGHLLAACCHALSPSITVAHLIVMDRSRIEAIFLFCASSANPSANPIFGRSSVRAHGPRV